jgi:hypothetical protein
MKTSSLIPIGLIMCVANLLAVSPPPDGGYPNFNTAEGDDALLNLTTGQNNTAVGANALLANITGGFNTAIGAFTLTNTTGGTSTATGGYALTTNTTGFDNTGDGYSALFNNTSGSQNTAIGRDALLSNTTADFNTAAGYQALVGNTTGGNNTAFGSQALSSNTSGSFNIALGFSAGSNRTTGNRNIDIGNLGVAGESNRIRIGTRGIHSDTFIAGISGVTVPNGVGVLINPQGHLGTVVSSKRFKQSVQPMNDTSDSIFALRPVTFHYKSELDPAGIPQFGLVAEEVQKVDPNLVAYDEQGKPYSVRYEAVNAMLLNEFLKEHRRVEEQVRINQEQEATIAELKLLLKEQTAQIQEVRTELALNKSGSELVAVED